MFQEEARYVKYGGLCLEAEDLPNAINLSGKKVGKQLL